LDVVFVKIGGSNLMHSEQIFDVRHANCGMRISSESGRFGKNSSILKSLVVRWPITAFLLGIQGFGGRISHRSGCEVAFFVGSRTLFSMDAY
jgi:hypothetical protein